MHCTVGQCPTTLVPSISRQSSAKYEEGNLGPIDEATLAKVRRRFAGKEPAVDRAFETSASFRGLCRDYVACANALARWQKSESEGAPLRAAEYSELLDELTREIEAHLHAEAR
jgi:hypothetical protein